MQDQVNLNLSAGQFTVGPVASADALTLVLPRTKYEHLMLVSADAAARMAVLLGGNDPFLSFPADNNTRFGGVLVPDVKIEVDASSACDTQYQDVRLGTIVRSNNTLSIATAPSGSMRFQSVLVTLSSGLPQLPPDYSAGFASWRIVLGTGAETQVLAAFTIDGAAAR